jgi:TetR/AcrR family transcriptional regulator
MPQRTSDEHAILDAAADVFAESGFHGARIDRIAQRAGVNKAMLYYRVGDKRELYRRVVLRAQEKFRGAFREALAASAGAGETLALLLRGVARHAFSDPLVPSIILRELAGRGQTLPSDAREGISEFMTSLRSIVRRGVEEGTLRQVDPIALQFMVMGSLFTLSLSAALRSALNPVDPGPLTHVEASDALLDIITTGVQAKGAGR